MSDEKAVDRLQQGYQPTESEFVRGYQPIQNVDVSQLKPPSNLGSAAVTPQNSRQPAPAPTEADK